MEYRNSVKITGVILQATQDFGRDGINVTNIIKKANVPHSRLVGFLEKLTGSGLINKINYDGKNTFVITEKGIQYLDQYKQFSDIVMSFGLEL